MVLFATALALNGLVFSAISAHAVPLFDALGFHGEEAVFMAALIGPAQVASRLGEILMGRRSRALHLGLLAFGLLPVAIAVFAGLGFSWEAALLFAVLYGASNGLVTIAKGAVPLLCSAPGAMARCWASSPPPTSCSMPRPPCSSRCCCGLVPPQSALLVAGVAALASSLAMALLVRLHPRKAEQRHAAKPPPARKVAAEPYQSHSSPAARFPPAAPVR